MAKRLSLKLLLVIGCTLLFISNSYAVEIIFSRFAVSSGLASNFVNCVWQDPRGLLWVGTANGLQRYDGSKFTDFYRNSNEHKLPSGPVHQIMGDAKGNMWIRMGSRVGTFNTFNYTFNEAKIILHHPIPAKTDYYLRRDYKGNFLLTIFKVGILIYNTQKHAFEERKDEFYAPSGMGINHSFEDSKTGNYWLSTDRGLCFYNYKEKKVYTTSNPGWNKELLKEPDLFRRVTHFHIDKQRRYWIVSWAKGYPRTFCFDEKTKQFTRDTAGLNQQNGYYEIYNFKESRGILWAYGLHFLKIYHPQERRFITFYNDNPNTGIKFNNINHIFQDKEKNVWLATDNGLYLAKVIFDEAQHGTIRKVHYEDAISSILETSNSHLLISTLGRGIEALSKKGPQYVTDSQLANVIYKGKPQKDDWHQMVWDIHEHSGTRNLWFACSDGHLIVFDPSKRRSSFISVSAFEKSHVKQIAEDKSGNLWFGTEAGKIVKLPAGRTSVQGFVTFCKIGASISKLYFDKKGLLWVATEGKGLLQFDPAKGAPINHFNNDAPQGKQLSDNSVKDILQLNDSLFYVADGNLDILNIRSKTIKQLTGYEGLPFTNVSSLQTDIKGDLWFSSIGGICTYNFKRNVFREYDQKDGLVTTTSADNLLTSSISLKNKSLAFAGGNTYLIFKPQLIRDKKRPENVTITDVKLFNNSLPLDSILKLDKLRLKHDQNSLAIEFASLSYTHRNKLIYYYKLEGADKNWIKSDGPIAANYSFLPPGNFVFKVKAVNSEGFSSASTTNLPILIRHAFWQTWWFKLFVSMSISAIIYVAYRIRLNQLLEVQKIRERVARDLHDDMGSTLSTINILSAMAKTKIKDNASSAEEYLGKISDNSVRMMEAMDDIVWSIKPSNDSIQKITARMREFASGILEPKDIDYKFDIDDEIKDITLNMEARRDLFLLFKEAINNLAKYSEATEAEISFYKKERKLILSIKDNGKGFDVKSAENGNGLSNMKKRSDKLKGKFSINSKPGKGTEICLELHLT